MKMKDDENCTYTKWLIDYRQDGDSFIVYKTRFRRPTWWPKNIRTPGYKETIELATIHTEIQRRFVVSFFVTGYYISDIEWSKETDISFIDRCRVWKIAGYIQKHVLYRIS